MSFYLLKSTYRREHTGDILLDLDSIESLAAVKRKFKDTENEIFALLITMKSGEDWKGVYLKEEELKEVMAEILGDKISKSVVNSFVAQERIE